MSSTVGHERRCSNRLGFLLLCCWITLSTIISASEANPQRESVAERKREQARLKDQQMLHSIGVELENICDVEQSQLLIFCRCDFQEMHEARDVTCTVFNVNDQNDMIWEAFRTQPNITELKLAVNNEHGRLNFLPTTVLRSLPDLLKLQVYEATIDTLLPHTFVDVPKVEELALNRNQVIRSTLMVMSN